MSGSATRNGPREWRETVSEGARILAGKVRRFALGTTARPLWQIVGHLLLDKRRETRDAEAFSGVGVYARPRATDKAEAIVVFIGDTGAQPIIIATRNEGVRQDVAGDIDENETILYNALAVVYVKADGTVEIRSKGGAARRLAFADELQAVASAFYGHGHPEAPSPPVESFSLPDPPGLPLGNPGQPGTDVLRGE